MDLLTTQLRVYVAALLGEGLYHIWTLQYYSRENILPHFWHRGQNSKQIIIAKYVSKFLIYAAKMLEKYVKSPKKNFVHCPFLQSQAK